MCNDFAKKKKKKLITCLLWMCPVLNCAYLTICCYAADSAVLNSSLDHSICMQHKCKLYESKAETRLYTLN